MGFNSGFKGLKVKKLWNETEYLRLMNVEVIVFWDVASYGLVPPHTASYRRSLSCLLNSVWSVSFIDVSSDTTPSPTGDHPVAVAVGPTWHITSSGRSCGTSCSLSWVLNKPKLVETYSCDVYGRRRKLLRGSRK